MAIDLAADLDGMLSTDDFGVSISFGGQTFSGILNKEFYEQDVGDVGVGGSEPVIYVKTSDVSNIADGNTITVDGTAYTVAGNPEPDGTGLTRIALHA